MEDGVTYETLQDLLRSERRSNRITPVNSGFWTQMQSFLRAVEDEFRDAQRDDPFSRKALMLTDRVKNARHAAENVWQLRERKLAMLALSHVKDGGQPDGLTNREATLYEKLLRALQENRGEMFQTEHVAPVPTVAPPAPQAAAPVEPAPMDEVPAEPEELEPPEDYEPEGFDGEPVAVPADKPDDMVTIRATGDIPPFVGPDMETYLLKEGDLAQVPEGIANLLVRRGKASVVPL